MTREPKRSDATRRRQAILILAVGVALAAGVAGRADDDAEGADSWPNHDACSFFGEHRQDFLESGLGAIYLRDEARAALTEAIVEQLPPARKPLRSRSRSYVTAPSGPISGENIDDFVFQTLERQGIPPAPPSTDPEFLRRVTIDLAGRIPTLQETVAFLNDASPDKRAAAADRLLADERWADRWALFLGDLFRNTQFTAQVNRYPDGRDAFHLFLLDALRRNQPYDETVRRMLAAAGTNDGRAYPPTGDRQSSPWASLDDYRRFLDDNPIEPTAASYLVGGLMGGGPVHDTYDLMAVNAARDFLGMAHMDCVLCHDGQGHLESLNLWGAEAKRSEGWGLAAFFKRTLLARPYRLPPTQNNAAGPIAPIWLVMDVPQPVRNRRGLVAGAYPLDTDTGNRPARSPADNGGVTEVAPVYPFGGGTPAGGENPREALGRLLTADRQFARATANYVWREFFGRGIVDPPDQFDLARLDPAAPPPDPWSLQPSHPELLEYLTDAFIDSGFDLKALMREIVLSDAYQLSSRYEGTWSASYEPYLARHAARRISAEALHDAVVYATGVPVAYNVSRSIAPTPFAIEMPDVVNTPQAARRNPASVAAGAFLDAFFRGDREESPRSAETSILQALQLMNNPLVVERIAASSRSGALGEVLRTAANDQQVVALLYLQTLSRQATETELAAGVTYLSGGDRTERAEDLMWALVNKVDFVFNY